MPAGALATLAAIGGAHVIAVRRLVLVGVLALVLVPLRAGAATLPPALYMSPSGRDGGSCTRAAPCASFNRAYALARPGAVIEVGPGSYGAQTIEAQPGRDAPRVVFRPSGRRRVIVAGELRIRAAFLEFRDMTLADVELPREAHHVTLRNISNHGIWMQGAANISVLGGEVTCGVCPYHPHLDDGGPPDYPPPRNILFDGVRFHDWHSASADQHTECLQILAGDGITIRNSVFLNCGTANGGRGATANLHISWLGNGPKTRDIVLENNFFFASGNTYAIQANDWAGLVLRYNSIVGPILFFGGYGDGTPIELVGNVMGFSQCKASKSGEGPVAPLRYRYNVLQGGRCHATDRNAPAGFVDPSRDLHLRPGAAAIGRGDPRSFPPRDIDGQRRPQARRPDAGADER